MFSSPNATNQMYVYMYQEVYHTEPRSQLESFSWKTTSLKGTKVDYQLGGLLFRLYVIYDFL